MNTPTKRFPVPECIKAIVVSDIRDNYEFLVGQFDGKAGKTRDKRAKILQEIYDKAEAKAKLENIDKHFENRNQMFAPLAEFCNFELYSILMDAYSVDIGMKSKKNLALC